MSAHRLSPVHQLPPAPHDRSPAALRRPVGRRQRHQHLQAAGWVAATVGRPDLAPFAPADVDALAEVLEIRRLNAGEQLHAAGSRPHGLVVVQSGQIALYRRAGRHRAIVRILRPGDIDGDQQVLLGHPAAYHARADEDSVVLHIDPDGVSRLLARPVVVRRLLTSAAMRLAESDSRILGLLGGDTRQKVARLLLDEAADASVALPQTALADLLGVSRSALGRALSGLEADGLIRTRYGAVDIVDADGLQLVADR